MPVAQLTVEIAIEHAQSLKDRRQVVRSLKDKVRHAFNVSMAEMDDASAWNRATVSVVAVNTSRDYLAGQLAEVEAAIERILISLGGMVVDRDMQMLD